jgi:predicted amidohydrolase
MYTPGTDPLVFTVDDVVFGVALCIEAHFPDLVAAYEQLGVDVLLLSVMVEDPARAVIAQAYAALHCLWIGYAVPAQYGPAAPAGLVAPGGRWLTRCPADTHPALAIADIDLDSTEPDIHTALRLARPWRRTATPELYWPATRPLDPRSSDRTCL